MKPTETYNDRGTHTSHTWAQEATSYSNHTPLIQWASEEGSK